MKPLCGLALLFLLASGCSTEVKVVPLPTDTNVVDGLPFRMRERLLVEVYKKTAEGYKLVGQQLQTLPNPDHVYVLRLSGKPFANSDTKFGLRADSTLATVNVGNENKGADAISALGAEVDTIGKKITEVRDARRERKAEEIAKLETNELAEVSYVEAKAAADVADRELSELGEGTKESVRRAKEGDVEKLRILANIAARKAQRALPFP